LVEQAYGVNLTAAQKDRICEIVTAYFREAAFETAAPFVDDSTQYLEELADAARSFVRALRIPDEEPMRTTAFRIRDMIEIAAPSLNIVDLEIMTRGIINACDAVKTDLEHQLPKAGIKEGRAWNELIYLLSDFAEGHKLTTGASKGLAKSKTGNPSPFVSFVYQLQECFPAHYRHYNHSHQGLAKAIGDARNCDDVRDLIAQLTQS
jgi:hypothetical protein